MNKLKEKELQLSTPEEKKHDNSFLTHKTHILWHK